MSSWKRTAWKGCGATPLPLFTDPSSPTEDQEDEISENLLNIQKMQKTQVKCRKVSGESECLRDTGSGGHFLQFPSLDSRRQSSALPLNAMWLRAHHFASPGSICLFIVLLTEDSILSIQPGIEVLHHDVLFLWSSLLVCLITCSSHPVRNLRFLPR